MLLLVQDKGFVCTKLKGFTAGLLNEYLVMSEVSQIFGSEGMALMGSGSEGL